MNNILFTSRLFFRLGVLLAAWAVLAVWAGAGSEAWSSIGPGGGRVNVLVMDPEVPAVMYAGTEDAGLFMSLDEGMNWFPCNLGLYFLTVVDLAIDPGDHLTRYLSVSGAGVYKSSVSCGVWSPVNTGLTDDQVYGLAVDPLISSRVYAGTDTAGVFKSTDGGGHWTAINSGLTNMFVHDFLIDPLAPSTLYAGTYGGGVFKSSTAGATWVDAGSGLTSDNVVALAIDPENSSTLYAGTWTGGISRSTDRGGNWAAANTGLTSMNVWALAIDAQNPATVYAGTDTGVFRSTDRGGSWAPPGTGIAGKIVNTVVIHTLYSPILFAGTYRDGVLRSSDSGASWTPWNNGLVTFEVQSLAVDPQDPTRLYAGTSDYGLFRSTDKGATWKGICPALTYSSAYSLAVDPNNSANLYAGSDENGLHRSTDWGETWVRTSHANAYNFAIAIDPHTPSRVYSGSSSIGINRSTDSGVTWAAASMGLPSPVTVWNLAIDPVTPAILYAGTQGSGVFKTTDGGDHWNAANTDLANLMIKDLAIHPQTPATLYAATSGGGVFRSTNGGGRWTAINTGLGSLYAESLAINPRAPATVYAGTADQGVFVSTDSGGHWSAMVTDLGNSYVSALAIDAESPQTIYAGTQGNSVYAYTFYPCPPPAITTQPAGQTVQSGQTATLTVVATGTPPLAYQWYEGESGDTSKPVSGATGSTFTSPPLTGGAFFWVRVSNDCGPRDSVAVQVVVTEVMIPSAPTGLAAAPVSPTQVNLTWQDTSTRETGFKIDKRAGSSGTFAQVATVAANVTAFANTGLTAGTEYAFRVRAYNTYGDSAYSNEATAATPAAGTPLSPSNLSATAVAANRVHLAWSDNASNEAGFKLERRTADKGEWSQVAVARATETHFDDRGVAADTAYVYRLRASNAVGDSAWSNEAAVTTSSTLPAAPSGLWATAASATVIALLWDDNAANESGFKVERRDGTSGAWAQIGTTSANGKAFADNKAPALTPCFYRVRAANAAGNSAYSNTATAMLGDYDLYIPAAAHTAGANDTVWRSDVDLDNKSAAAATVEIALLVKDQGNPDPVRVSQSVPAGQTVRLGDVLGGTPFNTSNAALGIRVTSGTVCLNSRFYNTASECGGTYGMYVDGADDAALLCGESGAVRGLFHHVSHSTAADSGFRTNIGFVNASAFNVQVVIRAYGDAGEYLGAMSHVLQPWEHRQFTKIHETLGTPAVSHGYITVEVVTAGGRVHAYAMLIDNVSGDPIYMPVKIVPY